MFAFSLINIFISCNCCALSPFSTAAWNVSINCLPSTCHTQRINGCENWHLIIDVQWQRKVTVTVTVQRGLATPKNSVGSSTAPCAPLVQLTLPVLANCLLWISHHSQHPSVGAWQQWAADALSQTRPVYLSCFDCGHECTRAVCGMLLFVVTFATVVVMLFYYMLCLL